MVAFENVSKRFDGTTAVHPLDLALEPGKVTALIGPSGCGKSTLLRLAAGLLTPDSGRVTVDGEEVTPRSAQELRRGIGYAIQDGGLFPHLTNLGNVVLMARHLGWERSRIDARISALSSLVRLPQEALDRFPGEVSGGQRQRVALMRALMLEPRVLLLDEPLGALDPLVRAALQDDLGRIFAEGGATVLLVTHDMGEAARLSDEIVLLREGRVVQRGPASAFRDAPAEPFVTEFLNAQRGWA